MGIQQYFINKRIQAELQKTGKMRKKSFLSSIQKVVIFVDEKTSFNETGFKKLQKIIGLDSSYFSILTFKEKKSSFNEFGGTVVVQNDINWQAKITADAVNDFMKQSYDLLIDYTQADNQSKQLIVAQINALLKVGYSGKKDELYDFMIAVNPEKIDLFNNELVRYLTILKLI